jgi:hypothetical protein
VWAKLLLPQYAFTAWCSAKAQGQFYLYLYHLDGFFLLLLLLLLLSLPLLPLELWGGLPRPIIPRLPLLLRITIYSRQVISLALEARYLGQLDSQYLYPLGSSDGPAIPPGTGCSF